MKKLKLILPAMVFLMAIGASFAFRPISGEFEILQKKVPPTNVCEIQTDCTLMNPGQTCLFDVYDEGCAPVPRYRP